MEKRSRPVTQWLGETTLVVSALILHLAYLFRTSFVDWPEMLLYPWFLTKGLMYYRDVVLAYVPGAYYLLYALYSMIGFSPQSERLIAYGFILFTDFLVYLAVRRLTGDKWISWLAALFFVLWQPVFSGNTIWYETMLAPVYIGVYLAALKYLERPAAARIIGIGVLLAIASLIKQTAAWPIGAVCLFIWLGSPKKWQGFWHALMVGGIVLMANALAWGYFALQGAGSEYLQWTYGFLLTLARKDSYYILLPTRTELLLIGPAFLPFLAWLFVRQKKHVWLIVFLAGALLAAGLPRWGLHRLQPLVAFTAMGFGVLLHSMVWSRKISVAIVGLLVVFAITLGSWRSFRIFVTLRDPMQPQFFGMAYGKLLAFGAEHLDQPYYILGNYDYLYFGLDDRPAVLPWVPLFPWNADVPGMQDRLISALEIGAVPYIVYIPFHPERGYYQEYDPRALRLYIEEKYEKIRPVPVEGGLLYQRK